MLATLRSRVWGAAIALAAVLSTTVVAQEHVHPEGAAPPEHRHSSEASLFATREGSGTAWLPDDTPMRAVHTTAGSWEVMLMGNLFAQLLYDSGSEHHSGHQAGSINWGMVSARRPSASGRLGFQAMLSLEPFTIPGCGYPDSLATGELCNGDTIHDRQHPHDLFMALAADYDHSLRGPVRWQVYGGLAGEPALGPPAFPHRPSAAPNPLAPIGHHWLDSTHITFGVVTAGVYGPRWKAEGSVFNGREPDEHRTDLDLGRLDSLSGRLSVNPTTHLAIQVSAGHLRDGEAGIGSLPARDVDRATASAIYQRAMGDGGLWATTVAYGWKAGLNDIPTGVASFSTHALLLESSFAPSRRDTWFGRFELVGKPAHDLHAEEYASQVFTLGKLQGGYLRQLMRWKSLEFGVGGSGGLSIVPPELAPRYEGRIAPGFGVFLSVQPAAMLHGSTSAGDGHGAHVH